MTRVTKLFTVITSFSYLRKKKAWSWEPATLQFTVLPGLHCVPSKHAGPAVTHRLSAKRQQKSLSDKNVHFLPFLFPVCSFFSLFFFLQPNYHAALAWERKKSQEREHLPALLSQKSVCECFFFSLCCSFSDRSASAVRRCYSLSVWETRRSRPAFFTN